MLTACSGGDGQADPVGEPIACALNGADDFTSDCFVERKQVDGVLTLIVHHPDGGFRRFDVQANGSGLAASDGADMAVTKMADNGIEVTLDGDRYQFPARIEGDAPSS
ncbi:hypothetical protein D6851_01755 [Altericroceibacterium spongiae]|uniref:Uncharacterized protein n=2 Tax=Altericroceibacterium spongiae TaxID=2320269 RepID=A0A420ERF9_9SPHN|nr:hypothetical protein D6851_01755 [Altericroceibacterium spongiae]